MSLLQRALYAAKATGTHHKLALDALAHLKRHDAEEWRNVFYEQIDAYIRGSKAPDDEFKDFKNHVLHVAENFWGGATAAAQDWYGKTVAALKSRQWKEAVYSAGVLSHYVTDPCMPFHTGQSEREAIIHRAAEWSINRTYDELRALIAGEAGGYPAINPGTGDDWLAKLVRDGATLAHSQYDFLIDHYNFELGSRTPAAGFDPPAKKAIARCIAQATVTVACVLDRAFADAQILVPYVELGMGSIFSTMAIPVKTLTSRMADAKDRALVEAMFLEYKKTGKVIETLPEDDKAVRQLHCQEVLKILLAELDKQKPGAIGSKFEGPTPAAKEENRAKPVSAATQDNKLAAEPPKPTVKRDDLTPIKLGPLPPKNVPAAQAEPSTGGVLSLQSPVVDAPAIGPKTADRLAVIGIRTIGDLLKANADETAKALKAGHITAEVVHAWQIQTRLALDVPGLKSRDVQLLYGVGIRTGDELAQTNARDLFDLVAEFCDRPEGQRILRDSAPPDLAEVSRWVVAGKKIRSAKAA